MPETLARQIEEASKGLPKDFTYRRMAKAASEFTLEEGSRTDVSTITTDAIDHQKEVVLPGGLDFAVFRSNPIVPFAHDYSALPVGKCSWIKASGNGIAAMTKYASRPATWTGDWLPDAILSLMQEGMCGGKSIGFIPTHMRTATADEISRRPELKSASVIVDKATLLEYSVAPVPCNPDALAISVSKSFKDSALAAWVIKAFKMSDGSHNPGADPNTPMPMCPKCLSNSEVDKLDDGYKCGLCNTTMNAEGDIVPEQDMPENKSADIIVPFISQATLDAYRKRLFAGLPAQIEQRARETFIDTLDRMRGRV